MVDHPFFRKFGDVETEPFQADRLGHFLQLTTAIPDAVVAFRRMVGKQQLNDHLPGQAHPLGVGLDDHSLADGKYAGGNQAALTLHLRHANPAGARGMANFHPCAKGRDLDSDLPCGLQNGCTRFHFHFLVIYC